MGSRAPSAEGLLRAACGCMPCGVTLTPFSVGPGSLFHKQESQMQDSPAIRAKVTAASAGPHRALRRKCVPELTGAEVDRMSG